jgi:hypothetical protein
MFSKLQTRLARLQLSAAMRLGSLSRAEELSAEQITDLRIIGPLFRVLDRRPVDPSGIEHVAEAIVARAASGRSSRLVATCAYYLCDEAITGYREIEREFEGTGASVEVPPGLLALRKRLDQVSGRGGKVWGDTLRLFTLWSSLVGGAFQAADPDVVTAIARSIGACCEKPHPDSGELTPSMVLSLAAHTVLEKGHPEMAQRLALQLSRIAESHGYQVIADMIYLPTVRTGTDEEYFQAIDRASQAARQLPSDDPARELALLLADASDDQWSGADNDRRSPSQRLFQDGMRLMRAGDRDRAAVAFEEAADTAARRTGEPATDRQYRGMAATLAFHNRFHHVFHAPDSPSTELERHLATLMSHDFASAREAYGCSDALRDVVRYCALRSGEESYAWLAAIVADIRGEYDGGLAVGHVEASRDAIDVASRELAVKDLLTGFIALPSREELTAQASAKTIIWVSEVNDNGEPCIVSVMLRPGDPAPKAFPTTIRSDRGLSVMRQATAAELDDADEDAQSAVATLREWIFRQEVDPSLPLLIIPDRRLWCLPWAAIVPPDVTTVTLAPSVSSAARLASHATRRRVPVVAGVFDIHLRGARQELKALQALAADGRVVLRQAGSLADLKGILDEGQIDLLTIATHGTSSDGFEYRLLFPDSDASPAGLLGLSLPPNVVLGCCWSARQGAQADGMATALACMSAGASTVVGALWAVDDWLAGRILASAYPDFAAGMPLAQAVHSAYLRRRERVTGAALAVLGLAG